MRCFDQIIVGIFSREDSGTYEWLTRMVTCTSGVKDVRPVLVTNTWEDFAGEVPKCSFGILYHSKTRGRLNVTDVTDSLYDRELEHLSERYGSMNVIVVIGDLEDSSDEKKSSILREQPKIRRCARDLFLFNTIRGESAPFQGRKMNDLKKYITKKAWRELYRKSFVWLICAAGILLIVIVVVSICVTRHPDNPGTSPPPIITHVVTNVTTALPTTIANATSSLTTQTRNSITQLVANSTESP